jgi:DNA polymerase I-like protein with 3'-5' exonuclease and polymerase domains
MIKFNPNSPTHVSALLFGGFLPIEATMPLLDIDDETPLLFKTGLNKGQIKTHKVKTVKEIKGLGLKPLKEWETKRKGIYSTKEEVLQLIASNKDSSNIDALKICELMLKIREIEKQIQTYYTGIEELIYDYDTCIHPSFNHVATDTGRLSCTKPNVQNVPTTYSLIKQHFVSRFNEGQIVSADYSQLEIRIQAQLCRDNNYILDVVNGIDFHCKRVALKENRSYETIMGEVNNGLTTTIAARSAAKSFSFARAYGAGKVSIAKKTGLTENEVQTLIENEDLAYPQLKLFNDINIKIVNKQGWYKDPWGKRYTFKKYKAPAWLAKRNINENYSPTEIKNYIVQGFATGSIVPVMVGKFWREKALLNRDKYLLINTIHDSVLLDCKLEFIENAKKDLLILEEVGILSKQVFDYEFKVPIKIDIKIGNTWFNC